MKMKFGDSAGRAEKINPLYQAISTMSTVQDKESESDIAPVVGGHLRNILLRPVKTSEVEEAAFAFRTCSHRRFLLFPGVIPLLEDLKQGFEVGLVSNAQSLFTRPELALLGLAGRFAPELISSEEGYKKPSAKIFQRALDLAGVEPHEALLVGNDPFADIDGASRCGIHTCRVFDRNFEGIHSKKPPSLFINKIADLSAFISGTED
jgi:HAD superfamily hydrolase (TIGR01509 family)